MRSDATSSNRRMVWEHLKRVHVPDHNDLKIEINFPNVSKLAVGPIKNKRRTKMIALSCGAHKTKAGSQVSTLP